ncbi:MAG: type IV pilus secretin PilQ [Pseudomonadota bacterium]
MKRTTQAAPLTQTWQPVARLVLGATAVLLAALAMTTGTVNAQEPTNGLQDIQIQSLPDRGVELRLIMREAAEAPLSFTIDNPARIVLDIPNSALEMGTRRQQVDVGPLDTVLMAEANGRTRAVLNLQSMVDYQTSISGNVISVVLSAGQGLAPAPASNFAGAPASTSGSSSYDGPRAIENIDFRRTREGGGRIIVTLTDPSTPVDIRQEGGRVVALFKDTELPTELLRRLDVQDFATPVTTVDAMRVNRDARVLIAADGAYEQLAYQSDGTFAIEISRVEKDESQGSIFSEEKEYFGERVTLNFQDIDARSVLQLLAEISGRNIVVSDTVQGNLTLRLQNVPWDQALDIVMTTRGLDMRENGNVIIVAPSAEIATREQADLEARAAIQELEPMFSEFLQINYAKAEDMADLISEGLLTPRGSVSIDERTNTLLLQDTAESLRNIRRLVATLDIPVQQVLIESRIVSVNDDYTREFGARLGLSNIDTTDDGLYTITGSGTGANNIAASLAEQQGQIFQNQLANLNNGTNIDPRTGVDPVDLQTNLERYNVNLPVSNPAGQIALALLEGDFILDLELSALQAEGRGEIVSSPRVVTTNQKEAVIKQGVEIPFQQAAASGATAVVFKEAVLSLTVTPQITPDGNIAMDLRVSQDTVGQIFTVIGGGAIPSIDTREVETQVLVSDGQTVVLGGIYETEIRDTISKVPLLGDIPGFGHLFKNTQRINNKSELLIFVTPKILEEGSFITQ